MAKVKYPLFSGDAAGDFKKQMIFRKNGVVSKYFVPRDPHSVAQLEVRARFLEFYVANLSREQADLLYAAILHLHEEDYAAVDHLHDHGALSGLGDDDHSHYLNQSRGDDRYSSLAHLHSSFYSALGHDHSALYSALAHDHSSLYSALAHHHNTAYSALAHDHSALYSLLAHNHTGVYSASGHDHSSLYSALAHDHSALYSVLAHNHAGVYSAAAHNHAGVYATRAIVTHMTHNQSGTIPASTTYWMIGGMDGLLTTERGMPVLRPGVVKNLYVRTNTNQPASGALVVTVRKDTSTDTALTITCAAGTGASVTHSDITHSFSVIAGSFVGAKLQNLATAASAGIGFIAFEIECDP